MNSVLLRARLQFGSSCCEMTGEVGGGGGEHEEKKLGPAAWH